MSLVARFPTFALSAFALSACSGSGTAGASAPLSAIAAPLQSEAFELAATNSTLVFVADAASYTISIYDANGKREGLIAGAAGSLAVDSAGSLYVANVVDGSVEKFVKPYDGKPVVVSKSGTDVAVAYDSGLVAIAGAGRRDAIAFYRKDAPGPCAVVTGMPRTDFIGFDAEDELFVDGQNANGDVSFGEIARGCAAKTMRALTTKNAIGFPGDVVANANDEIAIGDQSNSTIYTYARTKNGTFGAPVASTSFAASDAVAFAFADGGKRFWDADAGLGSANEFAYPNGGAPLASIAIGGQPIGIAVVPAVRP